MAMISAGADTLIQKATTGTVNYGEVVVSGVLGAAGGGITGLAVKKAAAAGLSRLAVIGVGAATGTLTSEGSYAATTELTGGKLTWQGFTIAGAAGASGGALGGAAAYKLAAGTAGKTLTHVEPTPHVPTTEEAGGSIRNINPGGGTLNCGQCSLAVDKLLAGEPTGAVAADAGPMLVRDLEAQAGGKFGLGTTAAAIEKDMSSAGSGARGIIFGSRGPGQIGHFFNVVNQNGVVRFLDGQTGTAANLGASQGYVNLHMLRTN
jgi:filamentous hemagglutinin